MSQALGSTIIIDFNSAQALNFSGVNKSTDILFTQIALGEGPIYRINPNGPQDIEIDDKYIDDLVNFVTNNTKPEAFGVRYSTGTLNPEGMASFIPYKVVPVRFSSPVTLKSGISSNSEVPAPPPTAVLFMPTNSNQEIDAIDCIRFKFNVSSLQYQTNRGVYPTQLTLVALIHERNQTSDFNQYIAGSGIIINELVDGGMNFDVEIKIPDEKKNTNGYRISVLKLTQDVAQDGFAAEVEFIGIDEIRHVQHNYPLTAVVGYAVKSSDFRTGEIPNYTSLLKGLIVDVPSNYNQPILPNGEVDWRQVEVPSTGADSAAVRGYRTQKFQKTLQFSSNINVYEGLWDGTYKKDWTENPVWIVKFLLTDTRLGMGLPETIIDKFNFYTIARYCDAVDFSTGNFIGVPGFSDGTFRFKPNGYLTEVENAILGLPEGTSIVERRFTCGLTVTDNTTALDLIQAICSSFRATLVFKGNKLSFVIDRDSLYPEALFNETNIEQNSFSISGINEEDLITGVEVSFINFANHFKRETIVLDSSSPDISRENRIAIDAIGCTRKSQALRLAKYVLDSNRSKRRKVRFNTNSYGSDLYPGSIISVSQRNNNLTYGYGGVVSSNTLPGSKYVTLEHITNPTISNDFFTSNTDPIILKIFRQAKGKFDYYIVDNNNSYSSIPSSNISSSVWDSYTKYEPFSGDSNFEIFGSPIENYIVTQRNPFNIDSSVWEAYANTTIETYGGGFITPSRDTYLTIDPTKKYRFSSWVRVKSANNNSLVYTGIEPSFGLPNDNVLVRTTGAETNNAYFYYNYSNSLPQEEWFLTVSHVWAANSGVGVIDSNSKNYYSNGASFGIMTDYVFKANSSKVAYKAFIHGNSNAVVQFFEPRIDMVNGLEPSISTILNTGPGFRIYSSSDLVYGNDLIDVKIKDKIDIVSSTITSNVYLSTEVLPQQYDLWALGYVNLNDIYRNSADKLFRVDTITVSPDGFTSITATEYNSNALLAIDNAAASLVSVDPTNLSFKTPPPPFVGLSSVPAKTNEGVIFYNLVVSTNTNTVNYNVPMTTNIQYGIVDDLLEIISVG